MGLNPSLSPVTCFAPFRERTLLRKETTCQLLLFGACNPLKKQQNLRSPASRGPQNDNIMGEMAHHTNTENGLNTAIIAFLPNEPRLSFGINGELGRRNGKVRS